MFCANCGRETGEMQECPYCGFNPVLDNAAAAYVVPVMEPEPVRIQLKTGKNPVAVIGFILSFFGLVPIVGIGIGFLALILSSVGAIKAKSTRAGLVLSIIGIVISVIMIIISIVIWAAFFREVFGFDY